ncbi:MAG: hypothetical protein ACPKM0_06245 [Pleomorphochaeta sp.]
MDNNKIFIGQSTLNTKHEDVKGEFVNINNEKYYKITNYDKMEDFFMTIVSDSNHWLFISSNGSLSAGRKDRDNALFPYYTVDKIHDYYGKTGSNTIIRVDFENKKYLWQPFNKELGNLYDIERNIYKSEFGNKIIFEEVNRDFGLSFEYGFYTSDKFGFIKKSSIKNIDKKEIQIDILDGIINILPSGTDYVFQNEFSNLLDSYKKNELIEETNLGLFSLSSIPVDRAEPSESLSVTTVWSIGFEKCDILLSDSQIDKFKKGFPVFVEKDIRAKRGSYYISKTIDLTNEYIKSWYIVAEINQSSTKTVNLNNYLKTSDSIIKELNEDIEKGTINLIKKVALSDGIQFSNEELNNASHYTKTMFNILRGGTYPNGYVIDISDFRNFVFQTNKKVSENIDDMLLKLPNKISITDLIIEAKSINNTDLIRLCYEYLPLSFSRRHGDPSRPWNKFSIENKNEDGSEKLDYQGNWRDIFQNWEALSLSFPHYIENIICKFVNASTADGYNPYRIMRDGIDWEIPDPNEPWAFIGYWGDHQIIYLQKLLELSNKFHPGVLIDFLSKDIFTFANVPYRIKSFNEIKKNPKETIDFDIELNTKIKDLELEMGSDAKLILNNKNEVHYVNFTEKILTTLLAKLSNFIPEAGIWLNTQRPEWNDANNALVGNGVSMVTLYYLRRFLKFFNDLFSQVDNEKFTISASLKDLFDSEFNLFNDNLSVLTDGFSDKDRLFFANTLGKAGEKYRNTIYDNSFISSKSYISNEEIVEFTKVALKYVDQSIRVNKRDDGLYHSYNLISFNEDGLSISYLYEMLEGQVAVLSSNCLSDEECLNTLKAIRNSKLYREDQNSYMLYPNRELLKFIEKNNPSKQQVEKSKLLMKLVENGDTFIIEKDLLDNYHFNMSFRNGEVLSNALSKLDKCEYGILLKEEKNTVLNIFEDTFNHKAFTGRSGTFYGYEGLGSIYWHMVSKLLLATEECFFTAVDNNCDKQIIEGLKTCYYEIKEGIGLNKSPKLYGAFPYDPYSHTPGNSGVKQPGMTGQVKEDIIARMGELGLQITNGEIRFDLSLINKDEFVSSKKQFSYYTLDGKKEDVILRENQFGFTFCQTPIIYSLTNKNKIKIIYKDGQIIECFSNIINSKISLDIFNRSNIIKKIEVEI